MIKKKHIDKTKRKKKNGYMKSDEVCLFCVTTKAFHRDHEGESIWRLEIKAYRQNQKEENAQKTKPEN